MERLTSNKISTADMSTFELVYNCCYTDNARNARYRDYKLDIDTRELIKNLIDDMCGEDLSTLSNEEFDEYMSEMMLSADMDSSMGIIALLYRNMCAMADLRERLKYYEDLEEQGRLFELQNTAHSNKTTRTRIKYFRKGAIQ